MPLARFAALSATIALLVYAIAELWIRTTPMRAGRFGAVGIDINQYLAYTHRWLETGQWYDPRQLAGPYIVEGITGNVYPPTLLYLTIPFALGLPMVLWWAVPIAIGVAALWRPAWWAWPVLAAVLVYPRTWTILVLGNPSMWAIAFALAGVRWGWPSVGAALKLTFAPLALIGIRRRAWWLTAAIALLLCLPFGSLWPEYLTVLQNAQSSRGLEYVLGEWPTALGLLVVAYSAGLGPRSEDQVGEGVQQGVELRSAPDQAR